MVLVGGHESAQGAELLPLADTAPGLVATAAGRPLHNVLSSLLADDERPVVVVPMTFGRNPTVVADTAKTLKWLEGAGGGRLVLADAFGSIDHLTAWLRAAATVVRGRTPDAAVVIGADAANPFDDAELHRVAHLVRTHGAGNAVEVALLHDDADVAQALHRTRLLGNERAVVVPAGFRRAMPLPWGEGAFAGAEFYGPLLGEQAMLRIIRERSRHALHELSHGRTGIESGLQADHGHGYAHSHAFDDHGHGHDHGHDHGHTHGHGGHSHDHAHNQGGGQGQGGEHGHEHPVGIRSL